jgi:uncharacterized protein (TIGR00725 family)
LGFKLLTGGRNCGVMEAAMQGAKECMGITIGILPDKDRANMSQYVDIPVITGLGNARNVINILSSTVVVVIGESPGTLSEVALSMKSNKPVIWLNFSQEASSFFTKFKYNPMYFLESFNTLEFERLIKKLTTIV